MEYYRRSGFDRRESISSVHSERRIGEERRELIVNEKIIMGDWRETPIFNKLTNSEFKNILTICSKQTFSKGEFIYQEGKKS